MDSVSRVVRVLLALDLLERLVLPPSLHGARHSAVPRRRAAVQTRRWQRAHDRSQSRFRRRLLPLVLPVSAARLFVRALGLSRCSATDEPLCETRSASLLCWYAGIPFEVGWQSGNFLFMLWYSIKFYWNSKCSRCKLNL